MLLTLLQSPTTTQAGYYSLFVWHYGGAGGFSAVGPGFGVYLIQRNSVIIGGGIQ